MQGHVGRSPANGYQELFGNLRAEAGDRFAIVASEFNRVIVDPLIDGARTGFRTLGVNDEALTVIWVPGALEIVGAVHQLLAHRTVQGVMAVGAVVRGATSHYDVVVQMSASQLAAVSASADVPIINVILTVDNLEQGLDRAGGKEGNKGFDGALSLVRMVDLYRQLGQEPAKE